MDAANNSARACSRKSGCVCVCRWIYVSWLESVNGDVVNPVRQLHFVEFVVSLQDWIRTLVRLFERFPVSVCSDEDVCGSFQIIWNVALDISVTRCCWFQLGHCVA